MIEKGDIGPADTPSRTYTMVPDDDVTSRLLLELKELGAPAYVMRTSCLNSYVPDEQGRPVLTKDVLCDPIREATRRPTDSRYVLVSTIEPEVLAKEYTRLSHKEKPDRMLGYLDITDIPLVRPEHTHTYLCPDENMPESVLELAQNMGAIPYETTGDDVPLPDVLPVTDGDTAAAATVNRHTKAVYEAAGTPETNPVVAKQGRNGVHLATDMPLFDIPLPISRFTREVQAIAV